MFSMGGSERKRGMSLKGLDRLLSQCLVGYTWQDSRGKEEKKINRRLLYRWYRTSVPILGK
jgi:hypothetical protein